MKFYSVHWFLCYMASDGRANGRIDGWMDWMDGENNTLSLSAICINVRIHDKRVNIDSL